MAGAVEGLKHVPFLRGGLEGEFEGFDHGSGALQREKIIRIKSVLYVQPSMKVAYMIPVSNSLELLLKQPGVSEATLKRSPSLS